MNFSSNRIYFLDGAMGTELQRRGIDTALPLWSAKALLNYPDVVKEIHKDYILSGADIITTNTFRTQRRTLAKAGLASKTEAINQLAVELVRQAIEQASVDRSILIAGSLTTLEDCYRPDLVPEERKLYAEHAEQARILAAADVDFFLLETFNTIREAQAAAEGAVQTGKPFVVSFVLNREGDLFGGEPLANAVESLDAFSPIAYSVNCVHFDTACRGLETLRSLTSLPLGAYAHGDGLPEQTIGWQFDRLQSPEKYAIQCKQWAADGVMIIGGCCGTSPEYTKLYSQL